MQNISCISELKNAIQVLEDEQAIKEKVLKEQFYLTYESLKPVNLLRSTLKDLVSSPSLIDDLIGAIIGLSSGFLSKKIIVGASGNIIRKLLGTFLQFGVTNVVAQHPDAIKSFIQFVIQHLFRKKEIKPEKT
jgi:hypothetical protein